MDLDKSRVVDGRASGHHRGIKSLSMADGKDCAGLGCRFDDRIALGDRSGQRLLHEHGDAPRQAYPRDGTMHLGRRCDRHEVDVVENLPHVGHGPGTRWGRNLRGPRTVRVHHTGQHDARHRSQNPRVVTPEVAHADNRRSQDPISHSGLPCFASTARPTIAMPAPSAPRMTASPSTSSVRPASIESAVAPASRIASMVATPTTGTSNRMS